MSSVCSSPVSQRSSTPPSSPQTTVTTPASGGASPKFPSYDFTPSPRFSPQIFPNDEQKGCPASTSDDGSLFSLSVSACFPTSPPTPLASNSNSNSNSDYNYNNYDSTVVRPVMIEPAAAQSAIEEDETTLSAYDQAFQQYFQYEPEPPQGQDEAWLLQTTTLPDDSHSEQELFWSNYTGYPPACAFYGPGWASTSSPVDVWKYQPEQWQTAGGRKVEYSAMHLHCATM